MFKNLLVLNIYLKKLSLINSQHAADGKWKESGYLNLPIGQMFPKKKMNIKHH